MKKIVAILLCITVLSMLFISVSAHEGHDHSSVSVDEITVDPLDQDGDGIPDYMDNLVDIDGDGVNDIAPTYQEPPIKSSKDSFVDTPWFVVLIVLVFIGVVASTVYLKIKTKGVSVEQEEENV